MEPGDSSNQQANEATTAPSETDDDRTIREFDDLLHELIGRYQHVHSHSTRTDLRELTNRVRIQLHAILQHRFNYGINTEQQAWHVVQTLAAGIGQLLDHPLSIYILEPIGRALYDLHGREITEIIPTARGLVAIFGEIFRDTVFVHPESWESLRAMVLGIMVDGFEPGGDPIPFNLTRDLEDEMVLEPFDGPSSQSPPPQENSPNPNDQANQGEASRGDEEQTWQGLGSNERPNERPVTPTRAAALRLLRRMGIRENCPICLERMEFGQAFGRLGCEHWFHAECLVQLTRTAILENRTPRCPNCRDSITSGSSSSDGGQRGPTRDQPETQAEVTDDDTNADQSLDFQAGEDETVIGSSDSNGQEVNVSTSPRSGAPIIEIVQEIPREPRVQVIAQPIIVQAPLATGTFASPRVRIFQQVEPEPERSTADADAAAQAAATEEPLAQTTYQATVQRTGWASQLPGFAGAVVSETELEEMHGALLDPSMWPPETLGTDGNAEQTNGDRTGSHPAKGQAVVQTVDEIVEPDLERAPRGEQQWGIMQFFLLLLSLPSSWIWRLVVAVWSWVVWAVATWLGLWFMVWGWMWGLFLLFLSFFRRR